MNVKLTNKTTTTSSKFLEEMRRLDKEEAKENTILEEIRRSGKPKKVDEDTYYENTWTTECRYCMHYNDKNDQCNKGVSFEEWADMDSSGEECDKYEYVYTLE